MSRIDIEHIGWKEALVVIVLLLGVMIVAISILFIKSVWLAILLSTLPGIALGWFAAQIFNQQGLMTRRAVIPVYGVMILSTNLIFLSLRTHDLVVRFAVVLACPLLAGTLRLWLKSLRKSPVIIFIRRFKESDTHALMTLFYDTVHEINSHDYSPEQVEAWAPREVDYSRWMERLNNTITYVAETDRTVVGFANLEENGHIDMFYCHKDYQRMGIGTKLLDAIEEEACRRNIGRLFTEASITAKPFFKKRGFVVLEEQTVTTRGVDLINYRMEKHL